MIKNVDKPSFAAGFFISSLVFGLLIIVFFLINRDTVAVEVYTCTYYDSNPQLGVIVGFSCFPGNSSDNPCLFADKTEYKGSFLTTKASINKTIEETEELIHSRTRYSSVNAALDFMNNTNEAIEKAINPFD